MRETYSEWLKGYLAEHRDRLRGFAKASGISPDWHEPDAEARVEGKCLDNACGEDLGTGEMIVVLRAGKRALRINLATLLALAVEER